MIQLKISHLDHSAKLTFPAKYERVVLALWSIGLDHDPEKYTLRRLGAEFTSTTEEESHMVQLIDPGNTLMQALCLLSEMMYPPHPIAERIHKKMAAGGYASEEDFFIEICNSMLPPGGKSNCTVTPAPCHHDTGSNCSPEDFTADRKSLKSY